MTQQNTDLARAERILRHPLFRQEYDRLQRMEKGRIFCCHSMNHFLDVARVCWIGVLEQALPLPKDVAYAAGLLHDIGKGLQYECGTPHQEAGAELAAAILPDCGYTPEETAEILCAIRLHRVPSAADSPLVKLLYDADKKTRLCFCCEANRDCNWPEEKKNRAII